MTTTDQKYRYRQIAQELRQGIGTQYKVGQLLASEAELADRFSVTLRTVRQALDELAEDGVVRRYHGRGTLVVDRLLTGEFAIVSHPESFGAEASPYWRMAISEIANALQLWNPQLRIKIHLGQRSNTDFPATLDVLEQDILRRLRAVFTLMPLKDVGAALLEAGVPVVSLVPQNSSGSQERYTVSFDYDSVHVRGFQHLKEAGCRTVGVLGAYSYCVGKYQTLEQMIADQAAKAGLETRSEWSVILQQGYITERLGYEFFERFWAAPNRPEGLLILDDVLCRGALQAMLMKGIDAPRDLKLVTHANRHVTLPYPKPISRVEFDAGKQARGAVEMMVELLQKQEPKEPHIVLPGEFVRGQTT